METEDILKLKAVNVAFDPESGDDADFNTWLRDEVEEKITDKKDKDRLVSILMKLVKWLDPVQKIKDLFIPMPEKKMEELKRLVIELNEIMEKYNLNANEVFVDYKRD